MHRHFKVSSFWFKDRFHPVDDTFLRSASPAGAARKAASLLLRDFRPTTVNEPVYADIELQEYNDNERCDKTYAYAVRLTRVQPGAPGVISFNFAISLTSIGDDRQWSNWLERRPESTLETWMSRPSLTDPRGKRMFRARTEARILQRQMLSTINNITKVLPQELVLRILDEATVTVLHSLCLEQAPHHFLAAPRVGV